MGGAERRREEVSAEGTARESDVRRAGRGGAGEAGRGGAGGARVRHSLG